VVVGEKVGNGSIVRLPIRDAMKLLVTVVEEVVMQIADIMKKNWLIVHIVMLQYYVNKESSQNKG